MLSVEEILESCSRYKQKHVVITGGEPLMHDLRHVVAGFKSKGYVVQIETSGTKDVSQVDANVWLTVSPKGTPHESALSRANEIIYPLTNMDGIKTLQQEIAPKIKSHIPIYLHAIGSQRLLSQAVQASFKYNYLLADCTKLVATA